MSTWRGELGEVPFAVRERGFSQCHGCRSRRIFIEYTALSHTQRIKSLVMNCQDCGRIETWRIHEEYATHPFSAEKVSVTNPTKKKSDKYSDYAMAKRTLEALGPKDATWTDDEIQAATQRIAQDVAARSVSSTTTPLTSSSTVSGTYTTPVFKKQTTMRDPVPVKMQDPNNYTEHLERAVRYASFADAALNKISTFDEVTEISELEKFLLELKAEKAKGYIALAQLHAQIAGVLA